MRIRMILVAVALTAVAAATARAQPQPTPPKDPGTPLPAYSLESLWQEIDCECDCVCCSRIKALIKKRLKDPRGRPQLAPDEPGGERKVERRGRGGSWRDLDLSDEQRERIAEVRHRRQLERVDLRAALQKEEMKLHHLLRGDEVTEREVRRHTDAMAKIRADIEFNRVMTRLESRGVLTEKQRETLLSRERRSIGY
jgi:Spy/CpxP family protein refolding chaperone